MMNLPGPIQKEAELAGCGRFGENKIFGGPPGTKPRFLDRPAGSILTITTDISWLALLKWTCSWTAIVDSYRRARFAFKFRFLVLQWRNILETV
jgi:hypothetical protein